jgi:predicted GIY-YIG superfamily endonuclease
MATHEPYLWPPDLLPRELSGPQDLSPTLTDIECAIAEAVEAQAASEQAVQWSGTVYLVHFAAPLHHAQHYLGWTRLPVAERLALHQSGAGAKLLRAAVERGIEFWVARTWPDVPQAIERKLKNRHDGRRLCPLCDASAYQHGAEVQR